MRSILLLSSLLWCQIQAVAQFRDSFDDGELGTNPAWIYNTGDFQVVSGRLNTGNAAGGSVKYGISGRQQPDTAALISYTFQYAFNPSSLNYTEFFFSADTLAELAQNGYFIRAGDLRDEISLYRLSGGVRTEIISGTDGELNKSNSHYTVVIERRADTLVLKRMDMTTGIWVTEGKTTVTGFKTLKFAGIHVVQSGTTVIGKHFFDNIYIGKAFRDTTPPRMSQATFIYPAGIRVQFSEPLNSVTVADFNFPPYTVLSATIDPTQKQTVHLQLNQIPALNKNHTLSNSGSTDAFANASRPHSLPVFTRFADTATRGQLYFTEVMANPSAPVAGLPDAEYVEIYNPTQQVFTLKDYILGDASSEIRLPDSLILPGQFLTISRNTFPAFAGYGPWMGVPTLPSLNNNNDILTLRNHRGAFICQVSYSEAWHADAVKRNGGWSLELMDTSFACIQAGNWTSNTSGGGTPGKANAAFRKVFNRIDNELTDIYVNSPDETELHFRYPADSAHAATMANYRLVSTGTSPLWLSGISDDGLSVVLKWSQPFIPNKVEIMEVKSMKTCGKASLLDREISFGLADTAEPAGIVINEILTAPRPGSVDYVELFNNSSKIIDLGKLQLVNAGDSFQPLQTTGPLSRRALLPGDFVCLTENPESVAAQYSYHRFGAMMRLNSLPSMPVSEGRLKLLSLRGITLDSLYYTSDMHAPLLADPEGVALEKTDPGAPASNPDYWTSAASTVEFGTPGTTNSQFNILRYQGSRAFRLAQDYMTPDNDGINDLLQIMYQLPAPGYYLSARVFNENGFDMGEVWNNAQLASGGSLQWDGNTAHGLLPAGNYIMVLEAFDQHGKQEKARLTFSVLRP